MSEKTIRIRCSALPLAFTCPGSIRGAEIPIDAPNEMAREGTAGHKVLSKLVETGKLDWEWLAEVAKDYQVDEANLRIVVAQGMKLWNQVRASFPNPSTEIEMRHNGMGVILTGHTDIVATAAFIAYVGDWKLGRLDKNYAEQIRGYMALVLLNYDFLTKAHGSILWAREQEAEGYEMDRAGLMLWLKRLNDEVVEWDGVYHPGTHCQYCPRSHECSAANALARRDYAIVTDQNLPGHLEDADTIRELVEKDPGRVIELWQKLGVAEKQLARVRDAIRSEVLRRGGIEGGGHKLMVQHQEKRHLNVWPAFPVLQEELADEQMAEVINISISRVEELVRKKAGKGNGAAAVRALQEKLDAAGAIDTTTTTSVTVRRSA